MDGAVVEVELIPTAQRTPTLQAMMRARVKNQVLKCTSCALYRECDHGPIPYSFTGTLGERPPFVVVGEAPGPDEDRVGRPFVGKSGRLLRAMMAEAGLPEPAFCNVVSCFPNKGGRVRAPSAAEIEACRGNLMAQLEAIDAPFVLLAGAVAVHQWRQDLTVTETRGQVYVWMRRWAVMPITHPASLLRNPSTVRREEMKADLAQFNELVRYGDGIDPLWRLGDMCIKCGGYVTHYDEEGVPWCETHHKRFRPKVLKAQGRLGKKDVVGQGKLI